MKISLLLLSAALGLTSCTNLTEAQNSRLLDAGLRIVEARLSK